MAHSLVPLDELLKQLPSPMTEALQEESTADHVAWWKVENKEKSGRSVPAKVYIFDRIGGFFGVEAKEFIDELNAIKSKNIELHLNSPGGEMFSGVAIYNALKQHPASISVFVDGLAASAAAFIAQSGDEVTMSHGSTMMIHDAQGMAMGNADEMRKTSEILDKLSDSIASIFATRAGGSTQYWRALMKEEVWYSAEEAVDAKLADQISGESNEDEPENHWNLAIFNYAGRSQAPSPEEVAAKVLRAKEAPVTTEVTNHDTTETLEPATSPEPEPEVDEATHDSDTEEEDQEATEERGDVGSEELEPANLATDQFVMIAGQKITDLTKIRNYVKSLETFKTETLSNARKTFVEQLAHDKKILATQIKGLEEFAAGLTDEQYGQWKASWESAPAVTALVSAGRDTGGDPGNDAPEEEITNLRETVMAHKLGGVPLSQIETFESYKRLKKLVPDFSLD